VQHHADSEIGQNDRPPVGRIRRSAAGDQGQPDQQDQHWQQQQYPFAAEQGAGGQPGDREVHGATR
jgi:hypothetical protein